jgi:hypothetical protein
MVTEEAIKEELKVIKNDKLCSENNPSRHYYRGVRDALRWVLKDDNTYLVG